MGRQTRPTGKKLKRRGCEISETSGPIDPNKTGYNEEPAKYMANPRKGFWEAMGKIFAGKKT